MQAVPRPPCPLAPPRRPAPPRPRPPPSRSPRLSPSLDAAPDTRQCPTARRPHPSARVLGGHPDVAAEQPEVMAQAVAKAAGPATPQEDAPLKPTKYTMDDFQVGQHVGGKSSTGTTYQGVVTAVGVPKAFVRVHLDEKAASGATDVLLYPHEITQIDEPKPEKHLQAKGLKESSTSETSASDRKQTAGKSASKPKAQAGDVVGVKIGDHAFRLSPSQRRIRMGSRGTTTRPTVPRTMGSSGGAR
jgi:hypothetical protein